jgi:hypothetical protein
LPGTFGHGVHDVADVVRWGIGKLDTLLERLMQARNQLATHVGIVSIRQVAQQINQVQALGSGQQVHSELLSSIAPGGFCGFSVRRRA